jgi:L-ascorbate metabolism protein UlaG (beta-lactamase superfamily)
MRRRNWITRAAVIVLAAAGGLVMAFVSEGCATTGTTSKEARLERVTKSPNWDGKQFQPPLPEEEIPFWSTLGDWIRGADHTKPDEALAVVARSVEELEQAPAEGLRITWFGHSTTLVEIDGHRILFDPVWSDRASPFKHMGPKRFHATPMEIDQLPPLDAVVISHDHYDHLDRETIEALAERGERFVVPLGVGGHLEEWGIEADRFDELDWWEEIRVGELTLVATPARHFSGRSLVMADRNQTLWAGWAAIGPEHRVYYSGDTAMFPGFAEIGERLGPFDVTMIEIGAYNAAWRDVHIGPEQAVEAHRMLRGKVMLPVHWGTFDLALHSWTEPAERVLVAARAAGVDLALPLPGESVVPSATATPSRWWPELPWQTAEEAPLISSGLEPAVDTPSLASQ